MEPLTTRTEPFFIEWQDNSKKLAKGEQKKDQIKLCIKTNIEALLKER